MILVLEILRGLAALWVFVLHVKDSLFVLEHSSLLYQFFSLGYLGVPMFFVISGYVIAYSAESHIVANKSPFLFIQKRLWRIYPTLWFSIIFIVALPIIFEILSFLKSGAFVFPKASIVENAQQYSVFEWLNIVFLTKIFWQQYDSLAMEFSGVNSVYWSLGIEVQFYIVVCIMMFFKSHFRLLTILVSLLSGVVLLVPIPTNQGLFLTFWLPFSFGIFLTYIVKSEYFQNFDLSRIYFLSLVSFYIVALITFFYFYTPQDMTRGIYTENLTFSLLFAVGLLLLYPLEAKLTTLQSSNLGALLLKPFLIMGAMSYTVYLLHTKLYVVATSFTKFLFEPSTMKFGFVTILLTLIFCYPIYYFVERRFMSSNLKSIHKY